MHRHGNRASSAGREVETQGDDDDGGDKKREEVGGEERKEGRSRARVDTCSGFTVRIYKTCQPLCVCVCVCVNTSCSSVSQLALEERTSEDHLAGDGASRMPRLLAHMHMERGTGILPNGWES